MGELGWGLGAAAVQSGIGTDSGVQQTHRFESQGCVTPGKSLYLSQLISLSSSQRSGEN